MKAKKLTKDGISLIVLVITIIVMIILAATVIITLSTTNIINKAQDAVDKTNLKQVEEAASLGWSEAYLKETNTVKDDAYYQTEVINYLKANGMTETQLAKYTITASRGGVSVDLAVEAGPEPTSGVYFNKLYLSPEVEVDGETSQQGYVFYQDEVLEVYMKSSSEFDNGMFCIGESDLKGTVIYEEEKIIMTNPDGTTSEAIVDPATGNITMNGTTFTPSDQQIHRAYRSNDLVENVYTGTIEMPDNDGVLTINYTAKIDIDNVITLTTSYMNGEEPVQQSVTVPVTVSKKGHIVYKQNTTEIMGYISPDGRSVFIDDGDITLSIADPIEVPYDPEDADPLDAAIITPVGESSIADIRAGNPKTGDTVVYNGYVYKYNQGLHPWSDGWTDVSINDEIFRQDAWGVAVENTTASSYADMESELFGKPVSNLSMAYSGCTNLVTAPKISEAGYQLSAIFSGCTSLETCNYISNTAVYFQNAFSGCTSLKSVGTIPSSVLEMQNAFSGCTSLTGTITINATNLTTDDVTDCFKETTLAIQLDGNCSKDVLDALAATSTAGNVTVTKQN